MCYRVEFVGSDTWGSQDDEGVWVGLLGLLAEDEVDLVLCHPTVTNERSAAGAFLHSTLHSRYSNTNYMRVIPKVLHTVRWN